MRRCNQFEICEDSLADGTMANSSRRVLVVKVTTLFGGHVMPGTIRKISCKDRFMVADVAVERLLQIPAGDRDENYRTIDVLPVLADVFGFEIIGFPRSEAGARIVYSIRTRRSRAFPDTKSFGSALNKVLSVHDVLLSEKNRASGVSTFADVDHERPNVTSEALMYCLIHRNGITARVVQLMRRWLEAERGQKHKDLRKHFDDDCHVVDAIIPRRDLERLLETLDTRGHYHQIFELVSRQDYATAVAYGRAHDFI